MKLGWILLGTVVVVTGGAIAFFSSTRAAAASKALEGFKVAPDCSTIEVIDQAKAEASMRDAAIVSFSSMDEPAMDLLMRMLDTAFPQCKPIQDSAVFSMPGQVPASIGTIRLLIGDRTVAEVKDMLTAAGGIVTGALSARDFVTRAVFGGV